MGPAFSRVTQILLRSVRLAPLILLLLTLPRGEVWEYQANAAGENVHPSAATPDSSVIGEWSVPVASPVVPIHALLLPNGKILLWDRHDHAKGWDGTPRLWDPASGQFTALPLPFDIFCAGLVLLADGRALIVGGHITEWVGEDRAVIFDPDRNLWEETPRMNAGRWYPSAVLLPDGNVLVLAGTEAEKKLNRIPQIFDVNQKVWHDLPAAAFGSFPEWPLFYPWTVVAPSGDVFMAGPQQTSRFLNLSSGAWRDGPRGSLPYREYGSFVLFEVGKGLMAGGSPTPYLGGQPPPNELPTASAEVIDLNAPSPAWLPTNPMGYARRNLNLVALPDGTVMAIGGSSLPGFDNPAGAVLNPEIWNPLTGSWSMMAPAARYRGYHSVALLLPDGKVWVAGGGHPDPEGGSAQANFEIYSPPYLFKGERPVISSASATLGYGASAIIGSEQASTIAAVRLIRLGAVTHTFDENQRALSLPFERHEGELHVAGPPNPNICPPGHYMLFIVSSSGVPSVAKIIHVK
jgi:galactose oxidase